MATLLAPLSKSEFTIINTTEFIKYIQKQEVPDGYKMMSLDVASLFPNVPLEETIEIILKTIYDNNEITTDIPKQEIEDLLILCTKKVHFTFNNEMYIQVDVWQWIHHWIRYQTHSWLNLKHQLYQT